jgi:hypothetical protein
MFLVSARLSSSLPSLLFLLSFYLYYNTVHFYSEVMHIGKILETYHFFSSFSFRIFFGSFFLCSLSFSLSLARQSNPFITVPVIFGISDGLFHIIDFSVILNYRKKVFLSSWFERADTIKSREIPFMCPYRLWNIFHNRNRVISFLKDSPCLLESERKFSLICAFHAAARGSQTWIFIDVDVALSILFFVYDS